jgi:hypothetical protein
MKRILACAFSFMVLLAAGISLSAKGTTTRIVISGADLVTPIEIADATLIRPFQVWAGAGTQSCVRRVCREGTEGFIIDWPSGVVADRPGGLQRYIVSFYTTPDNGSVSTRSETPLEQPTYVVWYEYDPAADRGFVYLPGKGDEWYQVNTRAIWRAREGNWFHATSAWQSVARPLVAR